VGPLLTAFHEIVDALGARGVAVIVTIALVVIVGGLLIFGYMCLAFGDRALEMLLPFLREIFNSLKKEPAKLDPAVRLELIFHRFLSALILFCLAATLLHALVPWVKERVENILLGGFITSFLLWIGLAGVSLRLTLRLK